MRIAASFAFALAMTVSAYAQTAPPAAPTLTAGAEFKGLRFDWDPVPGATSYQLEYRAHQTGAFSQQGSAFSASTTSTRFSFPLHLFDWTYARYRLAACNSAGCTRSADVSVSALRRDAVGYFKSSQPQAYGNFGAVTDLSGDGTTFVATAPSESDPTPEDEYIDGGAAYVFHRGADRRWLQRARLVLDQHTYYLNGVNTRIAVSGSGNTVAVSLGNRESDAGTGDVDIYYAPNGSGTYSRKRLPRPPVQSFGKSVALSESGYILAIGVEDAASSVAIYKSVNGVWQNVRNLPTEAGIYCYEAIMSRDGSTIAERCDQWKTATQPRRALVRVYAGSNWTVRSEIELERSSSEDLEWVHEGFAIDGTGSTIAVQFLKYETGTSNGTAQVRVYKRGTGGYSQTALLTSGAWRAKAYGYEYGARLALSGDGQTLAARDIYDNGTGYGPRAAPLVSGTAITGAVYVYRLTNAWKLANMVKPNNKPAAVPYFGWEVGLNGDGKTLIVSMPGDSSSSSGIDGDWTNTDLVYAGGVFLY